MSDSRRADSARTRSVQYSCVAFAVAFVIGVSTIEGQEIHPGFGLGVGMPAGDYGTPHGFGPLGQLFVVVQHPDSILRSAIARVAENNRQTVRVTSAETGRVEGNRVSLRDDSVFVSTESGVLAIALADVDSVWIYRGTAAPIVGLIFALPCAFFGGAVGNFIGGDPDGNGSSGKAAVYSIIGLLGGGAVCGAVGAGVGSLIERWRLEYVRDAPPSNSLLTIAKTGASSAPVLTFKADA